MIPSILPWLFGGLLGFSLGVWSGGILALVRDKKKELSAYPHCIKCGFPFQSLIKDMKREFIRRANGEPEHIRCTCPRCGFVWQEPCKDVVEAALSETLKRRGLAEQMKLKKETTDAEIKPV